MLVPQVVDDNSSTERSVADNALTDAGVTQASISAQQQANQSVGGAVSANFQPTTNPLSTGPTAPPPYIQPHTANPGSRQGAVATAKNPMGL